MKPKMIEMFEVMQSRNNVWFQLAKKYESKIMTDYSENYLKIQRLLKSYHTATLKNKFDVATKLAHDIADETIKLEFSTYEQVRKSWLS